MKKAPICPCCKYQPKINSDGNARKGFINFEEVAVSTSRPDSWDRDHHHIGWACPKCGVIFTLVK